MERDERKQKRDGQKERRDSEKEIVEKDFFLFLFFGGKTRFYQNNEKIL